MPATGKRYARAHRSALAATGDGGGIAAVRTARDGRFCPHRPDRHGICGRLHVERRLFPTLFMLTGGVLIWAAAFLAAYAFSAVACARGFADATVLGLEIVLAVAGLASLAAFAGIAVVAAVAQRSSVPPALRHVALVVCLIGTAGVLWNALPIVLVAARC